MRASAVRNCQFTVPTRWLRCHLSLDELQASPLAKELRIIVRYAEGYDLGPGSILPTIEHVACLLYPKPMSASGYALPPDFHQTPL